MLKGHFKSLGNEQEWFKDSRLPTWEKKLDIILVMVLFPEKRIYSSYFNRKGIHGRKVCRAARIVGSIGERCEVELTRTTSKVTVQNWAAEGDVIGTLWKLPGSRTFCHGSYSATVPPLPGSVLVKMQAVLSFSPCSSKLHVSCICLGILESRHGVWRAGDLLGQYLWEIKWRRSRSSRESLQTVIQVWRLWKERKKEGRLGRKASGCATALRKPWPVHRGIPVCGEKIVMLLSTLRHWPQTVAGPEGIRLGNPHYI